jgi:hypothetical protein
MLAGEVDPVALPLPKNTPKIGQNASVPKQWAGERFLNLGTASTTVSAFTHERKPLHSEHGKYVRAMASGPRIEVPVSVSRQLATAVFPSEDKNIVFPWAQTIRPGSRQVDGSGIARAFGTGTTWRTDGAQAALSR